MRPLQGVIASSVGIRRYGWYNATTSVGLLMKYRFGCGWPGEPADDTGWMTR